MSDIYNTPFVQGPQQSEEQPAQQQPGGDTLGAWNQWMSNPDNRAALIQFGLQMMQPVAPGQTGLGHFAQSVGSAGEAVTRRAELDRQEREQQRKQFDTESLADYRRDRGEIGFYNAETAKWKAETDRAYKMLQAEKFQSAIALSEAKIREIDSKIALAPAKEELIRLQAEKERTRAALNAAYTGLAQVRQDTLVQDSQTRARRADTYDRDVGSRIESRQERGAAATRRDETTRRGQDLIQERQDRAAYDNYILKRMERGPPPSFEEWKRMRGGAPTAPATTPAPPANRGSGTGPRTYKEGDVVVNAQGDRLRLEGNEWVPIE